MNFKTMKTIDVGNEKGKKNAVFLEFSAAKLPNFSDFIISFHRSWFPGKFSVKPRTNLIYLCKQQWEELEDCEAAVHVIPEKFNLGVSATKSLKP